MLNILLTKSLNVLTGTVPFDIFSMLLGLQFCMLVDIDVFCAIIRRLVMRGHPISLSEKHFSFAGKIPG